MHWAAMTTPSIQYNTKQYNTIQYNTIQYNTTQYNTTQHNIIQHNTIPTLSLFTLPTYNNVVSKPALRYGSETRVLRAQEHRRSETPNVSFMRTLVWKLINYFTNFFPPSYRPTFLCFLPVDISSLI